jgi:hypothetical protein
VYLKIQFVVIASLMLLLAGFNYVVDPYGVYSPDMSYGFNSKKTKTNSKERIIKPYRVSDLNPDTVILGMSSAGLGYDENHSYFSDKSVYNFSLAGASMYMIYRAFQHAMFESDLQNVLLDLNILAFNEGDINVVRNDDSLLNTSFERLISVNEDGSRNWRAIFTQITQIPQFLLSPQVTEDSLSTLNQQSSAVGWHLTSRGGWSVLAPLAEKSQGERFREIAASSINRWFKSNSSTQGFSIYREDGSVSRSFKYYERLLEDAYRKNIEVTLVLSPSHMYLYEAMDFLHFERMFTEWKRELVVVNEKVAKEYGKVPFPVWDFAYFSQITTEMVPPKEDNKIRMRWYYDPVHFTRTTGDHILDQVYLGSDGTGVMLTLDNVNAMLDMQQQKKRQFHHENPELKKRLQALFKRAATTESVDGA